MLLALLLAGIALVAGTDNDRTVINTNYGKIQGFHSNSPKNQGYYTFHNIPFAKPPIGKLRFMHPEEPEAWQGVRNGVDIHAVCIQPMLFLQMAKQEFIPEGQEDCLYLSVYTPKIIGDLVPVMVHIHGGGFIAGSGTIYSGKYLISENVVVVSINYRLGAFGFLSTEDGIIPGNIGLYDQSMALKWVQGNIAHFGGDPSRVTIFGESAGGASTHFHVISPVSRGLFSRAIMQSGNALCPWSHSYDHRRVAFQIGKALGCPAAAEVGTHQSQQLLDCLQTIDNNSLAVIHGKLMKWTFSPGFYLPIIDGQFITEEPESTITTGNYDPVDIMTGVTTDDGSFLTSGLFGSDDNLKKLNDEFDYYGPDSLLLFMENNCKEKSRAVYDHYLKKKIVDKESVDELTVMYSDRFFEIGTNKVARSHLSKVYLYEFGYRGKHSFGSLFGNDFGRNWVTHLDDLIYLFPLKENIFNDTETNNEDDHMKDTMTKLWANFAKFGNPTPDDAFDFKWEPFVKKTPKHLLINSHPEMRDHPITKNEEFWSSLEKNCKNSHSELNAPEKKTEL